MPEMTYLEAIRAAMHDEMEIDERVFVMGEDVGRQGGAFGATKELQQRFGEDRSIADDRLERIRSKVKDEVHEAVERADADGYADPAEAHLGVFAESADA